MLGNLCNQLSIALFGYKYKEETNIHTHRGTIDKKEYLRKKNKHGRGYIRKGVTHGQKTYARHDLHEKDTYMQRKQPERREIILMEKRCTQDKPYTERGYKRRGERGHRREDML